MRQPTKKNTEENQEPQEKSIDLFSFVNGISDQKNIIELNEETAQVYVPFMINRAFSMHADTILYANDMNVYHGTPKELHYAYLINSIRPRKRYGKWPKAEKNSDIDAIKEYYKYNDEKARSSLAILGKKQIAIIKEKLEKGGIKK